MFVPLNTPKSEARKVAINGRIQTTCKRSGLVAEISIDDYRKGWVHPEISKWTSHSDTDIRYPAIAVIERGAEEGWETLEQFEKAIGAALNPEPDPIEYTNEVSDARQTPKKGWIAKILGLHPKFDFERSFLEPVATEKRNKYYNVTEPGVYEWRSYSSKGNAHSGFFEIKEGETEQVGIGRDRVIAIFGDPEQLKASIQAEKEQIEAAIKAQTTKVFHNTFRSGGVGGTIDTREGWFTILKIETTYEDGDGIAYASYPVGAVEPITESRTLHCREATPDEIAQASKSGN